MTEQNLNQHLDPSQLLQEIDGLDSDLSVLHKKFINSAEMIGFTIEAVRNAKQNFTPIINSIENFKEFEPVLSSAYTQVIAVREEIKNSGRGISDAFNNIESMANSMLTTCTTSCSVAGTIVPGYENPLDTPSFLIPDENKTYSILRKLDISLADTYKGIEQVYYATDADNTRAAISQMRQAFDHFFDAVAPNDKVRQSKYWNPKSKTENPKLVTRRERILYAIGTHVNNKFRASLLSNSLDTIINAYNGLNSLHKRGHVNLRSAKSHLSTVKHFLEEFAASIEFPDEVNVSQTVNHNWTRLNYR